MFRKLIKNKKAQNTAEYAILISLVVAGIIAMQTYAQRGLQARVRDGVQFMATTTNINGFGNTTQYEPYYLSSNYTTTTGQSNETQILTATETRQLQNDSFTKESGGFQQSVYNGFGLNNGI